MSKDFSFREDSPWVSKQKLMEICNISAAMVQKLKNEGVFVPKERGFYELAPSISGYISRLQKKSHLQTDDGKVVDFHVEKARLTKAQADKAEMEAKEMSGELVRIDDVVEEFEIQLMDMKGKLLAIPTKLATIIADIDNPSECQDVIDTYIREALLELSGYDAN
jgi:phage terminase Nu1 subunit (DNA packaging protein)